MKTEHVSSPITDKKKHIQSQRQQLGKVACRLTPGLNEDGPTTIKVTPR